MSDLKLQQCRLDGRYDIVDCLSRGSYAEIYVARDIAAAEGAPQMVVIKALNLLLQGAIDEDLERTLIANFQNEAIALDRVRHPNIISRLGHGTAIDLSDVTFHYLVLEYMSGGELSTLCRQESLSLERALFYLEQVCAGLAHAHACGVIHRDIKPQNLLLTADKRTVKIADFGVAKLEASEGAITRVGTNVYAAPEHNPLMHTGQLSLEDVGTSQKQLTPAADIYSLAKTTYTLLAGEPPRRFSQRQITEFPAHIADKPWSRHVLRVLKKGTELEPSKRYQSVQEFWDELADAALPPTQLLSQSEETEVRPTTTGRLLARTESVPDAPPRPRFNSRRMLAQTQTRDNGGARPRIVVPVAATEIPPEQPLVRKTANEIIADLPDVSAPHPATFKPQKPSGGAAGRGKRWLVALLLIITFAGMLFATHFYIRTRWGAAATSNVQATNNNRAQSDIGREGTIVQTDVNLRSGPGRNNSSFGVAYKGSRVKVLSTNSDWYEVQVLQQGRDDGPDAAERGWMNKRFLKFD
ncbi:MAG TPA: serine/threonine protein kinase [Pyrinomonadaceae bacterium]|jgi:serine/threonine protein kinase